MRPIFDPGATHSCDGLSIMFMNVSRGYIASLSQMIPQWFARKGGCCIACIARSGSSAGNSSEFKAFGFIPCSTDQNTFYRAWTVECVVQDSLKCLVGEGGLLAWNSSPTKLKSTVLVEFVGHVVHCCWWRFGKGFIVLEVEQTLALFY